MPDPAIATAADYADAMLVARRAKSLVVLILVLCLLGQIGLFFAAKYTTWDLAAGRATVELPIPTTIPTTTAPAAEAATKKFEAVDLVHWMVGLTGFVGLTMSIVLSFVLLLLVKIMLVGRLIGVARVTGAYIWSLVLVVLLFPWQAFLSGHDFTGREFMLPGVLYTWDELVRFARFPNAPLGEAVLKWTKFVAFPVVTVILLLVVQVKSNRGLRQALGEDDLAALDAGVNRPL